MVTESGSGILRASVRWMARVTGLLLIGMVALFAFGEGVPDITGLYLDEQAEFFAMALMLVGFVVGWRWMALGGGLALGGFTIFCITELIANGKLPGGAILLFGIPGLLLLASHWLAVRS